MNDDLLSPGALEVITWGNSAVMLGDDECILDRSLACVRNDERHGYDWHEINTWGSTEIQYVRGDCRHLARHVVPVESGGKIVAHLCTTCDAQLP